MFARQIVNESESQGFNKVLEMVEVIITLDLEVLVKKIASSKLCPTSESPT